MLTKLIKYISDSVLNRFAYDIQYAPVAILSNSSTGLSLKDIFDGYFWATPKRRTPYKVKSRQKYGNDNWPRGTKMYKPKMNIKTCDACGHFHEFHTICWNCFKKVQAESKDIVEAIRRSWAGGIIDKEVQLKFQGETSPEITNKRVVEVERPRPLWFVDNLSQKSANPAKEISGPAAETDNRTIRVKSKSGST